MRKVDLVVIGGGAAGMAAAVSAYRSGVKDVLILERNDYLGGVLQQCIHNGFGLHRFEEDLTGVEFARKYRDMVEELKIPYLLHTFVIEMNENRQITAINPEEGLIQIEAKAIVLAMGCRERTRNNLLIPGTRGAGILTAGAAQRYLNINGYLPGKKVVILGSGDIGLIMARQFVLEGAEVEAVVEVMPYSGGLPRNMKQCIEDFDIPVYYNSTVSEICGKERVSSVMVSRVDKNRKPIPGTEFEIECDTLMISAGLIPENELTEQAGIEISKDTHGAVVTEDLQTSAKGFFACGNVLHVHDLVDFVATEAEEAGVHAAKYIQADTGDAGETIIVENGDGAGAVCPQMIHRMPKQDKVALMFRPRNKFRDVTVSAESDGKVVAEKKLIAVTPGEMIRLEIPADKLAQAGGAITVSLKGGAL